MFSVSPSQEASVSVGLNSDFLIKGDSCQKQHKAALLCVYGGGKPPQKLFWGLTLFLGQDTWSHLVYEPFNSPCFTQVVPKASLFQALKRCRF